MTLSPVDDRRVVARPDLPPYFLNEVCVEPGSAEPATEAHHLWRRSLGPSFREAWWVELSDGTILPNRVGLSQFAHSKITLNQARITWDENDGWSWLEKNEADEWEHKGYLDPQPPAAPSSQTALPFADAMQFAEQLGDKREVVSLGHAHVAEGETCPVCQRRVPHAKKKASPKTKVSSVRVPIDDVDTFEEMVDAAADHLGLKAKPHHKYWTLLAGLALVLQAPKSVMEES